MVERSRRSVGATLAAARAALAEGVAANLAGGTHHASAARGSGYCVFNDVAVASRAPAGRGAAAASSSSTSTSTRATARRRSSPATRACSRSRSTARRTSRSARPRATSTSPCPTAAATPTTCAALDRRPRVLGDEHARAAVRARLLPRRRRPARGRPPRPAQAQRRRPARARPPRPRRAAARSHPGRAGDGRRLRPRPRRHRRDPGGDDRGRDRRLARVARSRARLAARARLRKPRWPSTIAAHDRIHRSNRTRPPPTTPVRRRSTARAGAALALPPLRAADDALDRQRRLRPPQQRRLPAASSTRAVNAVLVAAGVLDIEHGEVIGLVVETGCNFFSSLAFPQALEAGLAVARIGRTSVRYEIGIFARRRGRDRGARPLRPRLRRSQDAPAGAAARSPARLRESPAMTDRRRRPAPSTTAITSRRSIRAFLPTPVPRETIEAILAVAARAPSGTNTQPWKVYVLTGDALKSLSRPARRRLRRPGRARPPHRGVRLLPDRVALALHRPAPQGRLGPLRPARHRQDRQGAHARAAPAQLRVLRRAGRPDVHDRPRSCARAAGSTSACSCRA